MIKMKDLLKESEYKFNNRQKHDGGYTVDVYYGTILLGTIEETEEGKYKVDLVKSPIGEYFPAEYLITDEENSFFNLRETTEILHKLWRYLRHNKLDIQGNW